MVVNSSFSNGFSQATRRGHLQHLAVVLRARPPLAGGGTAARRGQHQGFLEIMAKAWGKSWENHWKIMEFLWETHGKSCKIMEHHGKSWKIMENHGPI